jgi:hypothetical protein
LPEGFHRAGPVRQPVNRASITQCDRCLTLLKSKARSISR